MAKVKLTVTYFHKWWNTPAHYENWYITEWTIYLWESSQSFEFYNVTVEMAVVSLGEGQGQLVCMIQIWPHKWIAHVWLDISV